MARMAGGVGFQEDLRVRTGALGVLGRDDCALLRSVVTDPERRASLLALAETHDRRPDGALPFPTLVEAWRADGLPRARGSTYAAYFADVEGWTERWAWTRPGTRGRFHLGDGESEPGALTILLAPGAAFDAWAELAHVHRDGLSAQARARFHERAARPEARAAALSIDLVLATTWASHFGGYWAHEARAIFLDAVARYGAGVLPAPSDHPTAPAMRDPARWFHWAAALDAAALLGGSDGRQWIRGLWMAGIVVGCAADFGLRSRAPTRATYHNLAGHPGGLERRGLALTRSFSEAAAEARDLYALAGLPSPPSRAAATPDAPARTDGVSTTERQD